MKLKITDEFMKICKAILEENKNESEWAMIESSDMYQTEKFSGGFDADEKAFCFSYYTNNKEYWFQINLDQVKGIAEGSIRSLIVRSAET